MAASSSHNSGRSSPVSVAESTDQYFVGKEDHSEDAGGGGGQPEAGWSVQGVRNKQVAGSHGMWSVENKSGTKLQGWEQRSEDLYSFAYFSPMCLGCEQALGSSGLEHSVCTSPGFLAALERGASLEEARGFLCRNQRPSNCCYSLEVLASLAQREEWTLAGTSEQPGEHLACLKHYLNQQFLRLVDQGKVVQCFSDEGRAQWAVFCTGLLSERGEEFVYAVLQNVPEGLGLPSAGFGPEPGAGAAPWQLHLFVTEKQLQDPRQAWNSEETILNPPENATFVEDPLDLLYTNTSSREPVQLDPQIWDAVEGHLDYFPASLVQEGVSGQARKQAVIAAVQRTVQIVIHNPLAAVPLYFRPSSRSPGIIQILLPLKLDSDSQATHLALAVEASKSRRGQRAYRATRVLSLESAYVGARVLMPVYQPWLSSLPLWQRNLPSRSSSVKLAHLPVQPRTAARDNGDFGSVNGLGPQSPLLGHHGNAKFSFAMSPGGSVPSGSNANGVRMSQPGLNQGLPSLMGPPSPSRGSSFSTSPPGSLGPAGGLINRAVARPNSTPSSATPVPNSARGSPAQSGISMYSSPPSPDPSRSHMPGGPPSPPNHAAGSSKMDGYHASTSPNSSFSPPREQGSAPALAIFGADGKHFDKAFEKQLAEDHRLLERRSAEGLLMDPSRLTRSLSGGKQIGIPPLPMGSANATGSLPPFSPHLQSPRPQIPPSPRSSDAYGELSGAAAAAAARRSFLEYQEGVLQGSGIGSARRYEDMMALSSPGAGRMHAGRFEPLPPLMLDELQLPVEVLQQLSPIPHTPDSKRHSYGVPGHSPSWNPSVGSAFSRSAENAAYQDLGVAAVSPRGILSFSADAAGSYSLPSPSARGVQMSPGGGFGSDISSVTSLSDFGARTPGALPSPGSSSIFGPDSPWGGDSARDADDGGGKREKEDEYVEFTPADDMCPKINISQLPPRFVADFLGQEGGEQTAEQHAEQCFGRFGLVARSLVRENKNHPGKWFAIVEFSYWTDDVIRLKLVAGEQIRFPNFYAGEDVYIRRHKDKQKKAAAGSGSQSSGQPCRPEWKYTGTDTRAGKPLYKGPCTVCGRESTVPFKPVINGQPPRCRNCLPVSQVLGSPGVGPSPAAAAAAAAAGLGLGLGMGLGLGGPGGGLGGTGRQSELSEAELQEMIRFHQQFQDPGIG